MDKTTTQIDKEIEDYERKINDLKKKKEVLNNLTYEQQFATDLHSLCCTSNHTDQCGWFYESWEKERKPSRDRWLEKANSLLDLGYTFHEVEEIYKIIR